MEPRGLLCGIQLKNLGLKNSRASSRDNKEGGESLMKKLVKKINSNRETVEAYWWYCICGGCTCVCDCNPQLDAMNSTSNRYTYDAVHYASSHATPLGFNN
jgi:putative bacteriocin precursor